MAESNHTEQHQQSQKDIEAQLQHIFQNLSYPVSIHLFSLKKTNEAYVQAAREFLDALSRLSQNIVFDEHSIDSEPEMATEFGVSFSPTLVFEPQQFHITWRGAPVGEEAKTFVQALLLLGNRHSSISQESQKILSGLQEPRQIKVFVSPSCPYCPQQAVNALKAAVHAPDLVSLEIIDVQADEEQARRYDAQSTPMAFANEVLIGLGAQSEEVFMASLIELQEQSYHIPDSDAELVEADLVIVGGGPAGLTAGIYGSRSGLETVIIERGLLGGQVAQTPVVENYPGITQIAGKSLVDIMVQHALQYVRIFQGEEVLEVQTGERLEVTTSRRRFRTRSLLLATGADYRKLNVPGEARLSGRGVSYCSTCDGPMFKGRTVIMVGGGDSAATEALHLKNIGVDVTLVHRRDRLRAQDHLIRNLANQEVPVLYNTEVQEISGQNAVQEVRLLDNQSGQTWIMEVDGVFIAIGYDPNTELAKSIGLELTSDGYIAHDERHRTSIPGIYSAGDVAGGFKQIVTAAGQGSEAALAIFEDLINPYWKSE
jgi:thioredoxin reductase (NADPH)